MRRRSCSMRCTTAACCGWPAATTASAFTPRISTSPGLSTKLAPRANRTLVDVVVKHVRAVAFREPRDCRCRRLRYAVPQWRDELTGALLRAKEQLARARIDGIDWYWPADEDPATHRASQHWFDLLTPFDPIVWDRQRFELLWGWTYRFEAYTPPAKRIRGYYALPLLWRDRVIGWGNVAVKNRRNVFRSRLRGNGAARCGNFERELEAEIERMRGFFRL